MSSRCQKSNVYDPEEKEAYLFAFFTLMLASVSVFVLAIMFTIFASWVEAISSVFVLVVFAVCLYILKRGHLARAMWIAISLAHAAHLAGMTLTRGLRDPTFQSVFIVFVGAFYFLGYRSVLKFMLTVVIWSCFIYLAERFGVLTFDMPPLSPLESLIFTVMMVLLTGVLLYFTSSFR